MLLYTHETSLSLAWNWAEGIQIRHSCAFQGTERKKSSSLCCECWIAFLLAITMTIVVFFVVVVLLSACIYQRARDVSKEGFIKRIVDVRDVFRNSLSHCLCIIEGMNIICQTTMRATDRIEKNFLSMCVFEQSKRDK